MTKKNGNFDCCFKICVVTRPIAFNSIKKRIIFEVFLGTVFYFLRIFSSTSTLEVKLDTYIFVVAIFVVTSEGIFLFNKVISKKFPWHIKTNRRVILLVGFIVLWGTLVRFLARIVHPVITDSSNFSKHDFATSFTISILIIIIYVVLLIAFNYYESMIHFLNANERLTQEKLRLDYFALQDQVNPHFLFNNLSTLIAIIQSDPKLAVRFAENFSDVYRYVLQSADVFWVRVGEEVEFIKACFALHQERLGGGLVFDIDIPEQYNSLQVPPLSLQILVENAIKHNSSTLQKPLKINIFVRNNRLVVANTLNPRNSSYSTKTGLENLRKRYSLLTNEKPIICKTENEFIVEIPIIKNNNANESYSS